MAFLPPVLGAAEARKLDDAETNELIEFIEPPDDTLLCFGFAFSRASVGLMDFVDDGEAIATAVLIATVGRAPDGVPLVVGRPLPGMNTIPLLGLRWVTGVLGCEPVILPNTTEVESRPGRTRMGVAPALLRSLGVGEWGLSIRGLSDKSPDRVDKADLVDLVDRVDRTDVLRWSDVESRSGGVLGVEGRGSPVGSEGTCGCGCCFRGVDHAKGEDTEPALESVRACTTQGTDGCVEQGRVYVLHSLE